MRSEMSSKRLTKEEAADIIVKNIAYIRFIAFKTAPSKSLIEDITHDVFVYFVDKAESWEYQEETIHALLRKITKGIASRHWETWLKNMPDKLREVAEFARGVHYHEVDFTGGFSNLEDKLDALQKCLQKLSEDNRKLIELLYFEKHKYTEIFEKTGRSVDALYMQMCRIRTILHKCILSSLENEVQDA